jgi:N-dimethylarginine dimethylaminohydrolase
MNAFLPFNQRSDNIREKMEDDGMWNGKNQTEYRPIKRILIKHPKDAYRNQENADANWKDLGYPAPVSYAKVTEEFEAFAQILEKFVPVISYLPAAEGTGLDSLYTHDPILPTNKGIIMLNMGKPQRRKEANAMEEFFKAEGIPVRGWVEPPATHEGGDSVWLDENTLAVAHSFRTNHEGAVKLQELAGSDFEVISYGLPYWNGPDECLHIKSFISPVDKNLAVVYSRQMPIPFREELVRRGYKFIEVPDSEYDTFGPNVLAVAPKVVVVAAGSPVTRERLREAGCEVYDYPADDITFKGGGGPTCLSRGIERE